MTFLAGARFAGHQKHAPFAHAMAGIARASLDLGFGEERSAWPNGLIAALGCGLDLAIAPRGGLRLQTDLQLGKGSGGGVRRLFRFAAGLVFEVGR
jgi:hypothetical protein